MLIAKLFVTLLLSVIGALLIYRSFYPLRLFVLRAVGIFLLLAFLTNLTFRFHVSRKRKLDFYVDVSGSMDTEEKSRWRNLEVEKLSQHGLKFKRFGGSVVETENLDTSQVLSTDLAAPILDAKDDGVVLITDGIHNAPSDPYLAAKQKGIPIYFIIPKIALPKNIQIKSISTPRFVRQGEIARVIANIELSGMDSAKVPAILSYRDSTLIDTQLTLHNGQNNVELPIKAEEAGVQKFKLEIKPLDDEAAITDNYREFGLVVVKASLKGLVLASHPSPNLRMLRATLSELKNIDADVFVILNGKRWTFASLKVLRDTIPTLKDYDFLLLIDPTKAILKLTNGYDPKRTIILYGRNSNQDGLSQKLVGNFRIMPTDRFFETISDSFPENIPPLDVLYIPKNADVVEEFLKAGGKKGSRTLVGRLSDGQFVIMTSGFWTLRLSNRPLYDSIMSYLIQKVSLGKGIFIASVDKPVSYIGQELNFTADAFSSIGEPVSDISVQLVVDSLDTFAMIPTEPGRFEYTGLQLSAGEHTATIMFSSDTTIIAKKELKLNVKSIPLEYLQFGVDSILPKTIADLSGGMLLPSVDSLLKIQNQLKIKEIKVFRANRSAILLIFALIVLALEWWLRKNEGLI